MSRTTTVRGCPMRTAYEERIHRTKMDTGTNQGSGRAPLPEGTADTRGPDETSAAPQAYPPFKAGQFIRVKSDRSCRHGADGMVTEDFGDDYVALVFGYDRHNRPQGCQCVGHEAWHKDELDLSTLE